MRAVGVRAVTRLLVVALVVSVAGVSRAEGATAPGQQPTCVTVSLVPSSHTLDVNAVVMFEVGLNAGTASFDTLSLDIRFDPATLMVVDVSGNPATRIEQGNLGGQGATFVAGNAVDNTTGQISYSEGYAGRTQGGGSFTVGTLRFRARQPASASAVTFANSGVTTAPTFSAVLRAGAVVPFCPAAPTGGTVTVRGASTSSSAQPSLMPTTTALPLLAVPTPGATPTPTSARPLSLPTPTGTAAPVPITATSTLVATPTLPTDSAPPAETATLAVTAATPPGMPPTEPPTTGLPPLVASATSSPIRAAATARLPTGTSSMSPTAGDTPSPTLTRGRPTSGSSPRTPSGTASATATMRPASTVAPTPVVLANTGGRGGGREVWVSLLLAATCVGLGWAIYRRRPMLSRWSAH